jgi:deoxyribodipyrimidine photo-lyase
MFVSALHRRGRGLAADWDAAARLGLSPPGLANCVHRGTLRPMNSVDTMKHDLETAEGPSDPHVLASTPRYERALVWMRRDLRAEDNAALSAALRSAHAVWCVFLFDHDILSSLPRHDRRVSFIHAAVNALHHDLGALREGAGLLVRQGQARTEIARLARELGVQAVFCSHDDEPAALQRDAAVQAALANEGIGWVSCKDHVVFERREVLTQSGSPFSVFTPYKNAWLRRLQAEPACAHPVRPLRDRLATLNGLSQSHRPSLHELGFEQAELPESLGVGSAGAQRLLQDFLPRMHRYRETRDFPAAKGPSYLSVHLRFGTISIRELVRAAWPAAQEGVEGAQVWLAELAWRDFYHQILHHHPHVVERAFKPDYDRIVWESGPEAAELFQAWQLGRTGYPLVDAAMLQLSQTGYMHNRLRMVSASFLVKDLGIDWRWGEAHFAALLNDFDLAANNGGWQWAASSGCDAQPYFRIFNPVSQSEKFDSEGNFTRRYLPQLARLSNRAIHAPWSASALELAQAGVSLGVNYPRPIVDHAKARELTLRRYAVVKQPRLGAAAGAED